MNNNNSNNNKNVFFLLHFIWVIILEHQVKQNETGKGCLGNYMKKEV